MKANNGSVLAFVVISGSGVLKGVPLCSRLFTFLKLEPKNAGTSLSATNKETRGIEQTAGKIILLLRVEGNYRTRYGYVC